MPCRLPLSSFLPLLRGHFSLTQNPYIAITQPKSSPPSSTQPQERRYPRMPIVASPTQQAWIRVPPPRRNIKVIRAHQNDALKGPLAYFSCQPVPNKPSRLPPCPKYDIEYDEPLHGEGGEKKRGGAGKDRVVSAPAASHRRRRSQHQHSHYDEDVEQEEEEEEYDDGGYVEDSHPRARRSPPSRERSRPPPSHRRAAPPMEPQPRATSSYWTGPANKYAPAPRSYASSSQSGSTKSSVSARWANATAPLDLG